MIDELLAIVGKSYPLTAADPGEFASLKANGMKFSIRSYKAEGLGHVSVMEASGMMGLMKMDTLIVNPLEKDLPLYSYDRVHAMGNDTLIIELYDTLLSETDLGRVGAVKADLSDIPDHPLGEHWYDSIKLPESVSKKAKKDLTERFDRFTERYLAELVASAPEEACDPSAKAEKAAVYVNGLLEHGGPSTDLFLKQFGPERTAQLFHSVLFGI